MKGLIIVCTVLVQEQNLGQFVARWRLPAPKRASETEAADSVRPLSTLNAPFAREDLDEAS
jgi:simple sugar transport system permease protein